MDIYLSVNNREQVLRLPVLPPEFSVTKPQANETFETVTQGQLKLMGTPGLKGISWSSFFPVRDYPFLKDRTYTAFGYQFNSMPAYKAITKVCADFNIPIHILPELNQLITKIYFDKTISEIISDILTLCGGGYNYDITAYGLRVYKIV